MTATMASALTGSVAAGQDRPRDAGLCGRQRYTGGTAIDGGVLEVARDASLGAATRRARVRRRDVARPRRASRTDRAMTLGAGGGEFETGAGVTLSLAGDIAGSGALTKAGGGHARPDRRRQPLRRHDHRRRHAAARRRRHRGLDRRRRRQRRHPRLRPLGRRRLRRRDQRDRRRAPGGHRHDHPRAARTATPARPPSRAGRSRPAPPAPSAARSAHAVGGRGDARSRRLRPARRAARQRGASHARPGAGHAPHRLRRLCRARAACCTSPPMLGGDASPTDRLVVEGDTSGTGLVEVTNGGGIGAQTVERHQDHRRRRRLERPLHPRRRRGLRRPAGGRRRRLRLLALCKGGVTDPADGDWYLRSQDTTEPAAARPQVQPGVPIYEAYPLTLLALNGLPTMQERIGNRYWTGAGKRRPGADRRGDGAALGRPRRGSPRLGAGRGLARPRSQPDVGAIGDARVRHGRLEAPGRHRPAGQGDRRRPC